MRNSDAPVIIHEPAGVSVPALIAGAGDRAARRFLGEDRLAHVELVKVNSDIKKLTRGKFAISGFTEK